MEYALKIAFTAAIEELQEAEAADRSAALNTAAGAVLSVVNKLGMGRKAGSKGVLTVATGRQEAEALYAAKLIHELYDQDFLQEEEILVWQAASQLAGDTVASCKYMLEFSLWLRTADDESSSEDADESMACRPCKPK